MKKFKVGIQLYGVRNSLKEDFEGTIKAISEMGYEYVEFAGYYDKSAEEIKKILDKYNLKCISVHQTVDFFDENPDDKCAFLKAFGVKYSVIPWYDKTKLVGEQMSVTLEKFKAAAALLNKNGMMLGYHNHEFEFVRDNGKYIHDRIFEAIDEDKIVPELDTCWVRYAGLDPVDYLRRYKGRVEIVHLKDFVCKSFASGPVYDLIDGEGKDGGKKPTTRDENGFLFRPLGEGLQDFDAILSACDECGTELVIVEQDQTYDITELEAAKISREFLRNKYGL
ncbi:MAG: sugar phosphate isomerase/epimerase [Clostridia bacterium]|nr:sugar phosphate isomerase/epimerase [Clostridia bacterium]